MFIFKYKFNEDDFLTKYKARLIVRSDQQTIQSDIYAAILAARIFRVLMTIVAAFELETRQFDVVNIFVNNFINETIYCRTLDE